MTTLTQTFRRSIFHDVALVLGISLLLGLIAQIKISLFFSPIPIVLTTHAILFFSIYLGKRGVWATFAYLAQGALGLPVFSGLSGGIAAYLGPRGGYLIAFLVMSYVAAMLAERLKKKTPAKIFGVMLLSSSLLYCFGVPHLALFVGMKNAIVMGLLPFIPAAFLKLTLTVYALKKAGYFHS